MRTKGKSSKKLALRKLHGALKSMLGTSEEGDKTSKNEGLAEIMPGSEHKKVRKVGSRRKSPPITVEERNGVKYIVSREQQLIPMLTDDEIMERHRLADENMKTVWTSIIDKYESVEDQGDIVDLRTGEVVEDHGHLRGLSRETKNGTRYKSSLLNLLGVKDEEGLQNDLWQDGEDDEDDEDYDSETEATEKEDSDSDSQISEYERVLNLKIND